MGESFEMIVDVEASAEDAERLGERVVTWLAGEGIVLTGRSDCVLGPVLVTHLGRTASPLSRTLRPTTRNGSTA